MAVVNAKLIPTIVNNAGSPSSSAARGFFLSGSSSRRLGFRSSSSSNSKLSISSNSRNAGSRRFGLMVRAAIGENPTFDPEDFVVLGLGHCFVEDANGKLQDSFVIEPIGAAALECMENGGKTCYTHAASMTLETALKQDVSLFPAELQRGKLCDDFDFRTKCASRSWMREYPQETLVRLIPLGTVRSDFNHSLEDKRILNMVNVVTDADNIKQDMSIDVYGRDKDEAAAADEEKKPKADAKKDLQDDFSSQISSLYNA